MEIVAYPHVWRYFWSGYKEEVFLRAFSTRIHWIYWCKQSGSLWGTQEGLSYAKERLMAAREGSGMQVPEEFVLCYAEERGETRGCMFVQGFCDIQRSFRDFKKSL